MEDIFAPHLFAGIDGTAGKTSLENNLNGVSSRIFDPGYCLKAKLLKIRFKTKT